MNNQEKLEMLQLERADAERDLTQQTIRLDFFNNVTELPEQYNRQKTDCQALISFFQEKLDWYDLKIEELNAIISNTQ